MEHISGYFTIRRVDRDKPRYALTFKPEWEQIWSSYREGFTVEFDGDQLAVRFPSLWHERQPALAQVREEGATAFHGSMSRAGYEAACP